MDARYREQQRVGLSDATKGANLLATGVAFFTRGILIWLVFAIVDCACATSRVRTSRLGSSHAPPFPTRLGLPRRLGAEPRRVQF